MNDTFILKLDVNGNFIWVKQIGGESLVEVRSAVLDNNGNFYLTGNFMEEADFNPGTNEANILALGRDIYLLKLDSNGDYKWVTRFGNYSLYNKPQDVLVDQSDNIYLTGIFNQVIDFDPGAGHYELESSISSAFVLKLPSLPPSIGQSDFNADFNLKTYPNPFTNQIDIEFSKEKENIKISVTDALGKEIYSKQFDSMIKESISLDVKPGVYFLNIYSKSDRKTLTLIKTI